MDKLYVIIITYNGANWIEHCLSSVYNSTIENLPIVLDNGSTDDTLQIIRDKFPLCRIIETGENLGFGKANNLGMQMAIAEGADYIYLLNQDAWVEPDVFELLINAHKANPEYGIMSPVHKTGDGSALDPNFEKKIQKDKNYEIIKNWKRDFEKNTFKEVSFVMAAHWFLSVNDLNQIGLFSTIFPHYGEDNNLIDRYRYFGKKIGVCPNAVAYHDRQYRKEPPSKLLYIHFTGFLACINDPSQNTNYRLKCLLQFIKRSLCTTGTSFNERINNIKRGLSLWAESSKYRALYKQGYSESLAICKR